jgi:hypothetical protein
MENQPSSQPQEGQPQQAGSTPDDQIKAQIDAQIKLLKKAIVGSIDPCLHAQLIALCNATVQEHLVAKLGNKDYEFRGVRCLPTPAPIAGQQKVLFDFACRPGVFCVVQPSLLAVVNLTTRAVAIQDPYIPVTPAACPSDIYCGLGPYDPFPFSRRLGQLWLASQVAFLEAAGAALWSVAYPPRPLYLCSPPKLEPLGGYMHASRRY